MATRTLPFVTPEQYLEFDRNSEFKNEYLFGEIVSMAGGSFRHNLIAGNVFGELRNRLSGGRCSVLTSDMRVAVDSKSGYVYPDVTVVCGAPEFVDALPDTITNPKVVVEVLSPSTARHDLTDKIGLYLRARTLTDLIFIDQERIWIEHWYRTGDGGWKSLVLENADGLLQIGSLNCDIPVPEIYSGVDWPGAQKL